MRLTRLGTSMITAALLILSGCKDERSDKRLIDLAVKVNKHQEKVDQMERRLEGIERRLDENLAAARRNAPASGEASSAKGTERGEVDFRETPEYEQILSALSAVHQQLNTAQTRPSETKEGFHAEPWKGPVPRITDAFSATRNPQEFRKRLDSLVENFAHQIDDPTRRQQFVSDVEYLKHINADGLSTQELYERLVASLRERSSTQENEGTRKWTEHQLKQVESASAEDLDSVLERVRGTENLALLGEIRTEYDIPSDAMQEAGLPPASPVFRVFESGDGGVASIAVISSGATMSSEGKALPSKAIRLEMLPPRPELEVKAK